MLESLRNIFSVAELRNRVLFTLGLLAVYRVGHQIPTPGVNIEALALLADQAKNTMFGLYDMFSGGNLSQGHDLRAGHHALHQRVDHPAAVDRRLAVPRAAVEGRRAGAEEDHAVHPLRHDPAGGRSGVRHRDLPGAPDQRRRRPAARLQRRLGLPADDRAHADDGHVLRHVAGRADHRARHRQRDVAHHLRRHRRGPAPRRADDDRSAAHRADGTHPPAAADRDDGRGRRRDHLHGARPAARDGAVRRSGSSAAGCTADRARTSR